MILVDLNQVMISNLMTQINGSSDEISENLIRHMILNSLRMYNKKFKEEYNEMVIASDDKAYWRRDIFPFYKANRKKDRDSSPYDWSLIFDTLNKVRDEIKDNFPYKVIRVDRTEADDVIGTLVHEFGVYMNCDTTEKILILSSDKDFLQLQKFSNVDQYNPSAKKFIRTNNPLQFLREHIIKGDRGDGIPNILSGDDFIVKSIRQRPITSKKLNVWVDKEPEELGDEAMTKNFKRNESLIDLSKIPNEYRSKIITEFVSTPKKGKDKLLNYFVKHKMKMLIEHIQEF